MNPVKNISITLISIILLGLLYIYQQVEPIRISYEIKQSKMVLKQMKEENGLLKYKLALLTSPAGLEEKMRRKDMQLCLKDNARVVELVSGNRSLLPVSRFPLPARLAEQARLVTRRKYSVQFLENLFGRKAEAEQK